MAVGINALGCTQRLRQWELVGVDVNPDDARRASQHGALDNGASFEILATEISGRTVHSLKVLVPT